MPKWVQKYADYTGHLQFKKVIAAIMEKYWVNSKVNTDHLILQAGCGSIIEGLFWVLANEGDAAIIPGPIYPSFMIDAYARSKVNLEVTKSSVDNNFTISDDML
jgi:histidinol-phosphate/aromatic aminotransferase/cobyric acid decarboxylase-like protein